MSGLESAMDASARLAHRIWDESVSTLMMFFLAFAADLALAYGIKAYWHILSDTQVGGVYVANHPAVHQAMMTLFRQNIMMFCLELTVIILAISLLVAAAAEFLLLARLLFHSMSPPPAVLAWGAGIALAAAWRLMETRYWMTWEVAVLLAVLPALILCRRCFDLSHLLVPELPALLRGIRDALVFTVSLPFKGASLLLSGGGPSPDSRTGGRDD